jgi:hypothetical protein
MPNSWGIEIGILNGMVAFRPNVPGAQVGQPLGVAQNDLVHWINRTPLTIVLLSSQPPGMFLAEPIPPGQGSRPFFMARDTVAYAAMNAGPFPSQPHLIVVVSPPVA